MARSELVIELVKAALTQDSSRVKILAESIVSEERQNEHHFVADQLSSIISQPSSKVDNTKNHSQSLVSNDSAGSVVWRKTAEAKLSDIVLPEQQKQEIIELIREQEHAQELIVHGVEPRNRVLLKGTPGNGKTMLAEVIAAELGLPFLVVHYEDVVSSFLGETAGRLEKVFTEAAESPCVLFFDEFDVVAKERSDTQETGEIKRLVSTLLLQMDRLPSHTIFVAATNHASLLDSAVWRRFDLTFEIQPPSIEDAMKYWNILMARYNLPENTEPDLTGAPSFSHIEKQAKNIRRRAILNQIKKQVIRKEEHDQQRNHAIRTDGNQSRDNVRWRNFTIPL